MDSAIQEKYYMNLVLEYSISTKLKKYLLSYPFTQLPMVQLCSLDDFNRDYGIRSHQEKTLDEVGKVMQVVLREEEAKPLHSNYIYLSIQIQITSNQYTDLKNRISNLEDFVHKVTHWIPDYFRHSDLNINAIGCHQTKVVGEMVVQCYTEIIGDPAKSPAEIKDRKQAYNMYLEQGSGLLLNDKGKLKVQYRFWGVDLATGEREQYFYPLPNEVQIELNKVVDKYDKLEFHLNRCYGLFEDAILDNPTVDARKILSYLYIKLKEIDKADSWESPEFYDL